MRMAEGNLTCVGLNSLTSVPRKVSTSSYPSATRHAPALFLFFLLPCSASCLFSFLDGSCSLPPARAFPITRAFLVVPGPVPSRSGAASVLVPSSVQDESVRFIFVYGQSVPLRLALCSLLRGWAALIWAASVDFVGLKCVHTAPPPIA
jgi:hypothetical protein